jgi:hypothetical protein
MDNPLTPNKIQRLIHLAEDKSFNLPRRLLLNDEDLKRFVTAVLRPIVYYYFRLYELNV